MRYISTFSGVEAATLAWEPLGWEPVCFSEVAPFPSAVLAERWPEVPNLGDITRIDWRPYRGAVDLVVGGSPCQSFSIAGRREGLDGESRLMWEYVRAVQDVRPEWFVWENVPGALSVDSGRAFGALLREMDGLGYGLAWRVLDAQFFGVAQRRRRVFLVGCAGGVGRAAAVLFERESLRGDSPSSATKRKEIAARSGGGPERPDPPVVLKLRHTGSSNQGRGGEGAMWGEDVSFTLATRQDQTLFSSFAVRSAQTGANGIGVSEELAHTVDTTGPEAVLAFTQNTRDEVRIYGDGDMAGALAAQPGAKQQTYIAVDFRGMRCGDAGGPAGALQAKEAGGWSLNYNPCVLGERSVRRLTPRECERLQGMPDDHTRIPWRGRPAEECPDGPRYTAIGNSMAVPVMKWIGERIQMVDEITREDS